MIVTPSVAVLACKLNVAQGRHHTPAALPPSGAGQHQPCVAKTEPLSFLFLDVFPCRSSSAILGRVSTDALAAASISDIYTTSTAFLISGGVLTTLCGQGASHPPH